MSSNTDDEISLDSKWFKKLDIKTQQTIKRSGFNRKTLDEVFDKNTLLLLGKLISKKIIVSVDFPISTGKEANVFRAISPDGSFLCIKIFRTSTSTFKHLAGYIEGDPRFAHPNKNRRDIIVQWAKKEFKNLQRLNRAGVHCPEPLLQKNNLLLMQYLGSAELPAPQLKSVVIPDPQAVYDQLISDIDLMYHEAGLVHADLSEYNILWWEDSAFIIDAGQAVVHEHPRSLEFLHRDIHNINRFFKKFDISLSSTEKIYSDITTKHKNP